VEVTLLLAEATLLLVEVTLLQAESPTPLGPAATPGPLSLATLEPPGRATLGHRPVGATQPRLLGPATPSPATLLNRATPPNLDTPPSRAMPSRATLPSPATPPSPAATLPALEPLAATREPRAGAPATPRPGPSRGASSTRPSKGQHRAAGGRVSHIMIKSCSLVQCSAVQCSEAAGPALISLCLRSRQVPLGSVQPGHRATLHWYNTTLPVFQHNTSSVPTQHFQCSNTALPVFQHNGNTMFP
jgi:hypothetical protein